MVAKYYTTILQLHLYPAYYIFDGHMYWILFSIRSLPYLFSSLLLFIYRFSKYKQGKSREKRIIRYKKYHKHNKKYNRLYKLYDYSDTPYSETIMKLKNLLKAF